jgi:hypothetical protein
MDLRFYPFIKVCHLLDDTREILQIVLASGDSCSESSQYRDSCYHQYRLANCDIIGNKTLTEYLCNRKEAGIKLARLSLLMQLRMVSYSICLYQPCSRRS